VQASEAGHGKLTVRTRTGYFPVPMRPKKVEQRNTDR
jgi:hypothetical protein